MVCILQWLTYIESLAAILSDGDLKNILVEANVYAENICHQILQGQQYSRGIRALTLAADTLSRLFLKELVKWFAEKYDKQLINENLTNLVNSFLSGKLNNIRDVRGKNINAESLIKLFEENGAKNSSTFKYWASFLGDFSYFFLLSIS